jgi:hypothetical protein
VKLSLSQLERARKRPKAFAAAQLGSFGGIRPTFFGFWVFAAKLYHKLVKANDAQALQKADEYLLEHCRAKFSTDEDFDSKITLYSKRLSEYTASHAALNQPTIQTNKRVQFSEVPGHTISGLVARLDVIVTGGIAATNFELRGTNWPSELRTAIIQKALSDELRRPIADVRVGMYCLEQGKHDYVCLSEQDVHRAISESANVLQVVDTEIKRLKHAR